MTKAKKEQLGRIIAKLEKWQGKAKLTDEQNHDVSSAKSSLIKLMDE